MIRILNIKKRIVSIIIVIGFISCDTPFPLKFKGEGKFKDKRNGYIYNAVEIGHQTWMVENLNYDMGNGSWVYDNKSMYEKKYGRLYNWETAIEACPKGWHLPSDNEWKALELYLGMKKSDIQEKYARGKTEAKKMKSIDSWNAEGNGTNESGLTIYPGGYRSPDGHFFNMGSNAYYWTSTEISRNYAWYRRLDDDDENIDRMEILKELAFSVRCVKD